ncbi:MAG: hypothetical protein ACK5IB_05465 [Qingshengfaniella sp.]
MTRFFKSAALVSALGLLGAPVGAVALDPWTVSGPASPTVSQLGADGAAFTYDATASDGGPVTFIAQTQVTEDGTWDYVWNFSGFHAFFKVTAFLTRTAPGLGEVLVSAGPEHCCTMPSAGFSYSGTGSVAVAAGDILEFRFGGDNRDSNQTIRGTVTLSDVAPVPVAPAGVLLLSGLGALVLGKRRVARDAAA